MNSYAAQNRQLRSGLSPRWIYGFLICQFICSGVLVIEEIGIYRFGFRFFTFASSLLMLGAMLTPPNPLTREFPTRAIAAAYMVFLSLGFLHPTLNGPLVGIASIMLNLAIVAPLFWVPRIAINVDVLRRTILIVWGFYTLSAIVGVLQVYFPDRFMPDPKFVRQLVGEDVAESLKIQLDDGQTLFRPMGLSDTPGGAGPAGLSAFLMGLALAVMDRSLAIRILGIAGAAVGIFCVYISQVRTALIVAVIDLMVFIAITGLRGKFDRAAGLLLAGGITISAGFVWVMSVGSAAVGQRLETLTSSSAVDVYQTNRGQFLVDTFETQLMDYPLGAGLGRFGMMFSYFGDKANAISPPLYVEIQWTAWVFDGGLPLMLIALCGIMSAIYFSTRMALTSRDNRLADLATIVTTLNLGTLANCFGNTPFLGQNGMMFWLLNAALFTAAMSLRSTSRRVATRLRPI